jgi:hypothetical protein
MRGGGAVTLLIQCFYYVFRPTRWVIFDLFHAMHVRLTITVKISIWVDTPKTGDLGSIDNFY